MPYHMQAYEKDLSAIESMFEDYRRHSKELDTDTIEEILITWQQFIEALCEDDDSELADEIYEQLDDIQCRLDDYDNERCQQEDVEIIQQAGQRLGQSAEANLLSHKLRAKYQPVDIGREHQAHFRLERKTRKDADRRQRLIDKSE